MISTRLVTFIFFRYATLQAVEVKKKRFKIEILGLFNGKLFGRKMDEIPTA